MFKKDGSVHYSGIANEGKTADILNSIKYFKDTVKTVGGTKHKEDAISGNLKLSVKDKKKLSSGSFDWVNTSRYNSIFGNHFDVFKGMVSELREGNRTVREYAVEEIRPEFASLCNDAFDFLSKDDVCNLIIDSITHGIDYVFVNDQENKVLHQFNPINHPAISIARECDSIKFVTKRNAKGSRQVIFIKDNVEYDYGIRLRITSNNGIGAFLNVSNSKNTNSQIVIKLQQDSVHHLVNKHIKCNQIKY